jgi:RimJ/RimL family protein N-acetyltransferase
MSPTGRPEGEYRSAQREGSPVRPTGRPEGEYPSAERESGAPSADAGGGNAGFALRRIEEAALNAMQTQRQYFYDGWVLRVSPGRAKRGRSVNAFFGSTLPLAQKIAHCAALYQRLGLPLLFRITPFDQPRELDRALDALGYVAFDDTLVQTLVMGRPPELPPIPAEVTITTPDVDTFVAAAGDLRGTPSIQRAAHRERLQNAPQPRRYAVVCSGQRPVCTATIALEDGLAGIFDVVTADACRGRGYATLACAVLLNWAWGRGTGLAYLQVDAANTAALRVYRKFGFATAYTYHYRGRPGELA